MSYYPSPLLLLFDRSLLCSASKLRKRRSQCSLQEKTLARSLCRLKSRLVLKKLPQISHSCASFSHIKPPSAHFFSCVSKRDSLSKCLLHILQIKFCTDVHYVIAKSLVSVKSFTAIFTNTFFICFLRNHPNKGKNQSKNKNKTCKNNYNEVLHDVKI